jgi:hypothetical protein
LHINLLIFFSKGDEGNVYFKGFEYGFDCMELSFSAVYENEVGEGEVFI